MRVARQGILSKRLRHGVTVHPGRPRSQITTSGRNRRAASTPSGPVYRDFHLVSGDFEDRLKAIGAVHVVFDHQDAMGAGTLQGGEGRDFLKARRGFDERQ